MPTLNWHSYKWWPTTPPDEAEYLRLRGLTEAQMKGYLKTLLKQARADMTADSPYRYRLPVIAFVLAVVLFVIAIYVLPEGASYNSLRSGLRYAGGFSFLVAFFKGASASMTYDSIRKNLIVVREYYVKCWVAAQKLDYERFHDLMQKQIQKGMPNYDVQ